MALEGGRYGTALKAARWWGYKKIIDLLLQHGADPELGGDI